MEIIRRIRYARAERFGHPVPERELSYSPVGICPQRESHLGGINGPDSPSSPFTEDCLHLSIFTPARSGKAPVMVWLCGGAFIKGSGEFKRYDASALCSDEGIVVVNVSYRVGVAGFLYQPGRDAVNLGIEDQICALEWVSEHISEYGGDPDRICVCGQSAGAYSIASIIGRGRADLFSSAILFSAPLLFKPKASAGNRIRNIFFTELGKICRQGKTALDCSMEEMLQAQEATVRLSRAAVPFCPIGEKFFTPGTPLPKRILITTQKDDARPFVPLRILTGLATAAIFSRPADRYARLLQNEGCDAVRKVFDWFPKGNRCGACHTLDIPFLFGDWECWKPASMLDGLAEEEFTRHAKEFRKSISAFVKGL